MTRILMILTAASLAIAVWAATADGATADGATAEGAGAEGGKALVEKLRTLRPDIPIEKVSASPVPGIYALELAGGTIFYGTADGRFLFAGDLYELGDDDLINLAEAGRIEKRRELMAEVSKEEMLVFPAVGETKGAISVFTDVDCGYCRKLHQEVPKLNQMGIEVRYLAYPRAGVGSRSYQKIVSAWCAKEPNKAMTQLKSGMEIPDVSCENPVASQFDLGRQIGVTGTPAIVLEDGRLLPGYMPAAELAETVGI